MSKKPSAMPGADARRKRHRGLGSGLTTKAAVIYAEQREPVVIEVPSAATQLDVAEVLIESQRRARRRRNAAAVASNRNPPSADAPRTRPEPAPVEAQMRDFIAWGHQIVKRYGRLRFFYPFLGPFFASLKTTLSRVEAELREGPQERNPAQAVTAESRRRKRR